MTIKLRGNVWHIDVTIHGEVIRRSLRTSDRKEAKRRADALVAAAWEGALIQKGPRRLTLKEAFDELYLTHWSEKKDKAGVVGRFRTLTRFLPETTDVASIDKDRVDQVVVAMKKATYTRQEGGREYPYTRTTINRVLSLLGYILGQMAEKGIIEKAPRMPKTAETSRRRWVSPEEEAAMWGALAKSSNPNHLRCLRLFHFLTDTGCRMGEAFSLRWPQVDFDRRFIVLMDTKSGDNVGKPLTARALNALAQESNEGYKRPFEGIGETMYRNAWNYAKKSAGLGDDKSLVRHSLRHTTASRLVQNGVSLKEVQEFLGHKKFETTLRYAHLSPTGSTRSVEVLERVPMVCGDPAGTRDLRQDGEMGKMRGFNELHTSPIAQSVERRTVNP